MKSKILFLTMLPFCFLNISTSNAQDLEKGEIFYKSFKDVDGRIASCDVGPVMSANECIRNLLEQVDKDLKGLVTSTEQKILQDFKPKISADEIKNRFIKGQEAWIAYRNAQCESKYVSTSSTLPPSQTVRIAVCKISATGERANQIFDTFWR